MSVDNCFVEEAEAIVTDILSKLSRGASTDVRYYIWTKTRINRSKVIYIGGLIKDSVQDNRVLVPVESIDEAFILYPFILIGDIFFKDPETAEVIIVIYVDPEFSMSLILSYRYVDGGWVLKDQQLYTIT